MDDQGTMRYILNISSNIYNQLNQPISHFTIPYKTKNIANLFRTRVEYRFHRKYK